MLLFCANAVDEQRRSSAITTSCSSVFTWTTSRCWTAWSPPSRTRPPPRWTPSPPPGASAPTAPVRRSRPGCRGAARGRATGGDPGRQPEARDGGQRRNRAGHDPVPDRGPPGLLGGLAPVARQSGPRQRKPRKGQGDAYLKGYCTQAANGAANTSTFLGERLRRLSRRLGGNKAKCAVSGSILVIIWHLLADPSARFTDIGPGWHDDHAGRDRKIRAHLSQLKALGLDVTVTPAAA
jgi:hypothetical protein